MNPRTLLFLLIAAAACKQPVAIDNIETPPRVSPADTAYADVFQPLDGRWAGTFYIYQLPQPGPKKREQLYPPRLDTARLERSGALEVRQQYTSVSPYFQRVAITDIYPEKGDTVRSEGVNKVQDGKLWCVVRKPDETVVHRGAIAGDHTVTWSRNERSPQRIEYFHETVTDSVYAIRGWGYYAGDDTTRMPRYWFSADYRRQ